MKRRITLLGNCALAIVIMACMALGNVGWAAEVVLFRGSLATLTSSPRGLSWELTAPYQRVVLVVKAPGGKVIREEYDRGSTPGLGGMLADGQYTYELTVTPFVTPEARQALANARATGDMSIVDELRAQGALPQGPHVQSGYFRVHRGAVIPPQGVEPPYRDNKNSPR